MIAATILTGLEASDCLLPCLRTITTVEEGFESSSTSNNLSAFALGFSKTVREVPFTSIL